MDEIKFTNSQVKTQIRNHNHHFTEITKQLGVNNFRLESLESVCNGVPLLKESFWQTEMFLQKY